MPSTPILESIDVLVVGATVSGVYLALKAHHAGHRVALTSARAFLGEDVCADFAFEPGSEPRRILRSVGVSLPDHDPLTPRDWKVALETALVQQGIPFYFQAMPYAALKTSSGSNFAGAFFSSRSGGFAITARCTIDASTEGYLRHLLPPHSTPPESPLPVVRHRVLNAFPDIDTEHPERADFPLHYQFDLPEKEREAVPNLYGREYLHPVTSWPRNPLDWHRLEAGIRASTWQAGDFQSCDRLTLQWPRLTPPHHLPSKWDELTVLPGFLNLSLHQAPDDHWRAIWQCPWTSLESLELLAPSLPVPAGTLDPNNLVPVFSGETLSPETKVDHQVDADPDHSCPRLEFSWDQLPCLGSYDVVVLGGGTGGASAAIGAARGGARTAVVESLPALGGVGTLGQITRYWFGNQTGFTTEIDHSVAALEWDQRKRKGKGKGGWSVSAKTQWYLQTALDLQVDLLFRSFPVAVTRQGNQITGLVVVSPYGFGLIRAGCFVDATGSAEIAALAGAPTTLCGEDHLAVQGTGLAGVIPGKDYHNSDHNFSDETNLKDTVAFIYSSRRKFPTAFDIGQLIDSRERRQIIGDYRLQPVDILYDRTFPDTICRASSNFDSHGFTIHPLFMILPPTKERLWANVPFRCLLPQGLERVLSTGLGLSSHRDALPVIRMQPDVQNQGYAAGRAAALSALQDTDLRQLDLRELQEHLIAIGNLDSSVLDARDSFPVDDAEIERVAQADAWSFKELALVFTETERILPHLQKRYSEKNMPAELQAMMIRTLGLLGDSTGADDLNELLTQENWDEGWNFRGMHQFGFSLSPIDTALIALARSGDSRASQRIAEKIRTFPDFPDLSHARALCLSVEALRDEDQRTLLAPLFHEILLLKNMTGHEINSLDRAWTITSEDPNENEPRNLSLREIYLARALFHCRDQNDLGRQILTNYSHDLRGHFSRHARFLLRQETSPAAFIG